MTGLDLVKFLRPLLPFSRIQNHLTDCAGYEVLDRAFHPYLMPLRKRHVLGFEPLPRGAHANSLIHPVFKRVPTSMGTE